MSTQYAVSDVIDITHYSSRIKVLRVTAWVLKFVRKCKSKEGNLGKQGGRACMDQRHSEEVFYK